ncbi:MAG TPA: 3-hydroxyacyl-CoA dehydrogenase family protein [Actinomycetes bacterium]|nr:3-hydroxyacyl-CoA dehydrogenase family protein [Actinomycetes bacterium]
MAEELFVVGAGLMGSGIAQVAAAAGYPVTLQDTDPDALERALAAIRSSLGRLAAKGSITEETRAAALERVATTTDPDAGAGTRLAVEAVFERLDVKQEVFRRLDALAADDAVLASNTSALPITSIARATRRPEAVVGTHFFSPVPVMALCELVRGLHTSDETLRRAREFAQACGKTTVTVRRDVAGFVTTRLLTAVAMEAARLVEQGVVSAEELDTACRLGFAWKMGPLATMDLTGLDVLWHAGRSIHEETGDPKFLPPETVTRMVQAGQLGRKTGRGWFSYPSP